MKNNILSILLLFTTVTIQAQVPSSISYQGSLLSNDGTPLNGQFNINFKLFDSESGGNLLWEISKTNVNIENGIFSVILDNLNNLSFESQYWLGIAVNGGAELNPRTTLTSVPYSLSTKTIPNNIVTNEKITNEAVTLNKISKVGASEGKVLTFEAGNFTWKLPDNQSPTGSAGGDLSGTYPNPSVSKIQGKSVSSSTPSTGHVLKWNGSLWVPAADETGTNSGGTVTQINTGSGLTGGPISNTGTISAQTGSAIWNANKIQGNTISSSSPSSGQVLKWSGSQWTPSSDNSGGAPSGSAGGDLSGTYPNPTVTKLQGKSVSSSSPSSGEVLKWNGSQWAPSSDNSGGAPSGSAGGDLSGNYPNPSIASNAVNSAKIADGTITTLDLNFTPLTNPFNGDFKTTGSIQSGDPSSSFSNGDIVADDDLIADDDLFLGDNITLGGSIGWSSQSSILDYTGSGSSDGILWLQNLSKVKVYGGLELNNSIHWSGTQGIIEYSPSSTIGSVLWFSHIDNVWAESDLLVDGNISKGGGSFKIDHPLDPENKYLYHSFVESPDMMNVYNGNTNLDQNGDAVVKLPDYFEALNMEFRYQLACIGGYSNIFISDEINNNQFKISGGSPNLKVSWQVTGIRKDPYAQQNRINVEVEKNSNEKGYYLHHKAYNQPESQSIRAIYESNKKLSD